MTSGCHSGRPLIATPTSARFREGLLGSSCRVAGSSCHGGHLLELYRQPLRPGPAPWVLPDLTICCEPHQQAPACPGPPTRAARRSPERVPTSCMNAFSVPHALANGFRCGCWLLVSWSGGAARRGRRGAAPRPAAVGRAHHLVHPPRPARSGSGRPPRPRALVPPQARRLGRRHPRLAASCPADCPNIGTVTPTNTPWTYSQTHCSPNSTPLHNHESRVIRNTLETTQKRHSSVPTR